ncbi:MAG: hypothetical protein MJE77_06420 [Proteobacteria bacterium]|nr:hypothetical protein [Pseudomonadota bacterium]
MLNLHEDLRFRGSVLAIAGLLAILLIRLRFCYVVSLPAKIPQPDGSEVSLSQVNESVERSPSIYAGYLQKDAESFGISPTPTAQSMARAFHYQFSDTRRRLNPRRKKNRSVDIGGLRLSVSLRKLEGTPRRMMVLAIDNLTDRNLAYNVVTRPTRGSRVCSGKAPLLHNAVAIKANGREERSECLYRKGWALDILRVETVALPEISYFYVSKVPPTAVGVEARVSVGHSPPVGPMCNLMLPAAIRNARQQGKITWRDLIDFFARHRCETYPFPDSYRAISQDGQVSLPALGGS